MTLDLLLAAGLVGFALGLVVAVFTGWLRRWGRDERIWKAMEEPNITRVSHIPPRPLPPRYVAPVTPINKDAA